MHCYIFSCTLSTSGALICSCHWTMHTFHYIFLFILKHSESGKSSLTEIAFQKLRNTKPGLIRKRNLHNIFTPFSNIFAKLHERWLDFCSRRNQFWIWILHILFFGKCKTILIRPLKHSIHYFLNIFFLSSICLLLIFFFLFSDLSMFVMKPTLQVLSVILKKIKRTHRPAFLCRFVGTW